MKRKTVIALLATMALTTGATATAFAANFADVKEGTPVSTYVTDVTDKGLMEGETDTEFGVAEGTTRSDLVQALYKLNLNLPVTGSHEFTDIDGREDAAAIEWADDVGLFDELKDDFFTDNKFEPDKELTREEAAQILYTFAQKVDKMDVSKGVGTLEGYTDSEDVTVSYEDAMKWVLGNKIFTGDDLNTDEAENAIRPTTAISKAETAQALSVYMTMRGNTQEEVKQVTATVTEKENIKTESAKKDQVTGGTTTNTNKDDQEDATVPETPITPEKPETPGTGETDPEKPTDPEEPENPDPEEPENPDSEKHTHTWGDPSYVVDQEATKEWVVDKPAEYEQKWVVDKPAEYKQNWVVDKEAVYDEVKVVDKEAVYRDITEVHTICKVCGKDFTAAGMTNTDVQAHIKQEALAGQMGGYYEKEVVVGQELVSPEISHTETVLVSPEEGHYENGALISPEEGHYENGDLISPEEGHWVTTPELGHWEHTCADCGETENCPAPEV